MDAVLIYRYYDDKPSVIGIATNEDIATRLVKTHAKEQQEKIIELGDNSFRFKSSDVSEVDIYFTKQKMIVMIVVECNRNF